MILEKIAIDNYGNQIPMYDLERTIVDLIRSCICHRIKNIL